MRDLLDDIRGDWQTIALIALTAFSVVSAALLLFLD